MPVARLKFRKFHAGQQKIYENMSARTVLRCGRRFGKTIFLETHACNLAVHGRKVGWFTPDYKIMRPTYQRILYDLKPIVARHSKTDALIELVTGGLIEFWTLDNEDAGRSRDYDDIIVDEASLVKKGMKERWQQSIAPTLLDRRGNATMGGTPKGVDPENFFYLACTDKEMGWKEHHAPTRDNPTLDPVGVANLQNEYPPLVYQQEFLAEFVDWSGDAFFSINSLLPNGVAADYPTHCDAVYAVIDSATKTGKEHDGTAVVYVAYTRFPKPYMWILDWDIVQIEGAMLETWLPGVVLLCEHYAAQTRARSGSLGVHIEDKASGMILIQQAQRRGLPAMAIDSGLTSVGKDERAISVSGYVWRKMVALTQFAHEKVVNYKGNSANHFLRQVVGYRIGQKDQADDLLDAFAYSVAIGLGNEDGF